MTRKKKVLPDHLKVVHDKGDLFGKEQVIYNRKIKKYHWVLIAKNGKMVCNSELMSRKADCIKGLRSAYNILAAIVRAGK